MRRLTDSELIEAFWQKVDRSGECWIWTGAKYQGGYGCLKVNRQNRSAHRFSWELENGAIPDGFFVCHHCDNPSCIRPDHLFLGTQADNMRDAHRKGRLMDVAHLCKLSDDQIAEIRRRYAAGETTQRALAREYGVTHEYICRLIAGKDRPYFNNTRGMALT
jgi:hypothetical protein